MIIVRAISSEGSTDVCDVPTGDGLVKSPPPPDNALNGTWKPVDCTSHLLYNKSVEVENPLSLTF